MREMCLYDDCSSRHKLLKERITLTHRINRSPAIRRTDLDKTPIKTLEFDAWEFSSIGRSLLLFALLEK